MENTTQGTGTIQAKVCLAFKLDTSNDHIRTRVVETFTHTVLFNTTCQRPIYPRFESTKVDRTFESSVLKIFFQSYSRHYSSQFISYRFYTRNRSEIVCRSAKFEEMSGTDETKTSLRAMNRYRYRKQRWISFDNDRIWIVRRVSFIRNVEHPCFTIISRKIDSLSPMMEWRARTRARTLVASHSTTVELHLREQVNA